MYFLIGVVVVIVFCAIEMIIVYVCGVRLVNLCIERWEKYLIVFMV